MEGVLQQGSVLVRKRSYEDWNLRSCESSELLNFSSSFHFHGSCLHVEVPRFGTQAWVPCGHGASVRNQKAEGIGQKAGSVAVLRYCCVAVQTAALQHRITAAHH
jgi:hypothetical protein